MGLNACRHTNIVRLHTLYLHAIGLTQSAYKTNVADGKQK